MAVPLINSVTKALECRKSATHRQGADTTAEPCSRSSPHTSWHCPCALINEPHLCGSLNGDSRIQSIDYRQEVGRPDPGRHSRVVQRNVQNFGTASYKEDCDIRPCTPDVFSPSPQFTRGIRIVQNCNLELFFLERHGTKVPIVAHNSHSGMGPEHQCITDQSGQVGQPYGKNLQTAHSCTPTEMNESTSRKLFGVVS